MGPDLEKKVASLESVQNCCVRHKKCLFYRSGFEFNMEI